MNAYKLSGKIADREGKTSRIWEFITKESRKNAALEFYLSNGFIGVLTLTTIHADGTRTTENIRLTGDGLSTPR